MNPSSLPKQLVYAVVILLTGFLVYGILLALKKEPPQHIKPRPIPIVEVEQVKLQTVAVTIESQGTVQASREVRLISEVAGRVTSVSHRLQNGTLVEKSELLLQLDPTDYEAVLAQTKADLLTAQLNYKDRTARYHEDSLTVKQAAAQVEAAEKALAQAKNNLSNTQIVAPFAGAIRNKAVDLGQYVAKGSVLFELTGTEQVEVRLPVQGNDMTLLYSAAKENQLDLSAVLTARVGNQSVVWPARVTRIEAAVDSDTRVYYVVAVVNKPYEQVNQALSLGLFVNAAIDAPPLTHAVVLPRNALHDEQFVYVLSAENILEKRAVEVARLEKEFAVITGGLIDNDKVVITRLQQMYEGLQVDPQIKQ